VTTFSDRGGNGKGVELSYPANQRKKRYTSTPVGTAPVVIAPPPPPVIPLPTYNFTWLIDLLGED
jgi:hypothetical protein